MNMNGEFLPQEDLHKLGLARFGAGVLVHRSVVLINCDQISLGDFVRIDAFSILSAGQKIQVGRNVHIGAHCILTGQESIILDDFSGLSHGVKVYASSDDYSGAAMTNPTVPENYRRVQSAPVHVGRHAIVGSGTVILPGAHIGEGCAVGALSLVNHPIDPWGIYVGIPAKKTGSRSQNILALETEWLGSAGNHQTP
jgi:acetyltransferase-like isoleucine patch superfamily enzyme